MADKSYYLLFRNKAFRQTEDWVRACLFTTFSITHGFVWHIYSIILMHSAIHYLKKQNIVLKNEN